LIPSVDSDPTTRSSCVVVPSAWPRPRALLLPTDLGATVKDSDGEQHWLELWPPLVLWESYWDHRDPEGTVPLDVLICIVRLVMSYSILFLCTCHIVYRDSHKKSIPAQRGLCVDRAFDPLIESI
jgi:hypothetical protein